MVEVRVTYKVGDKEISNLKEYRKTVTKEKQSDDYIEMRINEVRTFGNEKDAPYELIIKDDGTHSVSPKLPTTT